MAGHDDRDDAASDDTGGEALRDGLETASSGAAVHLCWRVSGGVDGSRDPRVLCLEVTPSTNG